MSGGRYLPEVQAGLGEEAACNYCGARVVILTVHGAQVAVDYTGDLHRQVCPEMRRLHRQRQRARRAVGREGVCTSSR